MNLRLCSVEADVLVIGDGAAGGMAALEAAKTGVRVLIVDKGAAGKAGATPTAFARASRIQPFPLTHEELFKLVLQIGCYLNDQDVLWLCIKEAPEILRELKSWAKREEDSYSDALNNEISKYPNINLLEYTIVTKLLTDKGRIVGATALDIVNGRLILFKSKAIVLATGGYGEVYKPSQCTPLDVRTGLTGDGQALAYDVGAEIVEMEMTQHQPIPDNPKWMKWTRHMFPKLPGDGFRGVTLTGPYYDADGNIVISTEEIASMPVGCAPPRPMVYKPLLIKRIYEEMHKGQIYVDLLEKIKSSEEPVESMLTRVESALKVDVMKLPKIKIVLGCLIGQGGPRINIKGETNVPGLYAAGECPGNVYGAFRPEGFMYSTLVMGKQAGKYAAEYASAAESVEINMDDVEAECNRVFSFLKPKPNSISPLEVKKRIWKITREFLSVVRDEKGLLKAIEEIEEIREVIPRMQVVEMLRFNLEWMEAIEVPFMIDVAEMIARSALLREESRGCHNRRDFPEMDNKNWLKHTLLRKKEDGEMEISSAPIVMNRIKPNFEGY